MTLCQAGRPEAAIPVIEKAKRLTPYYPAWYDIAAGLAYRMTGQYAKAIEANEAQLAKNQWLLYGHVNLAATYALKGDLDMARVHAAKVLEVNPEFSLEWYSKLINASDLHSQFFDALRRAGLPEKALKSAAQ